MKNYDLKNYDLLKVIASRLNGLQYPLGDIHIDKIKEYCQENGIVVCYGESDDLMELRGAIYEEYGCYDGGTICIDENGEEGDANKYYPIEAVWNNDYPLWTYKFEPRHENFNLYEGSDLYCVGIVFFADDLKRDRIGDIELLREAIIDIMAHYYDKGLCADAILKMFGVKDGTDK